MGGGLRFTLAGLPIEKFPKGVSVGYRVLTARENDPELRRWEAGVGVFDGLCGLSSSDVDLLGFEIVKVRSFMIWSTIALSLSSMVVQRETQQCSNAAVRVVGCAEN